MESANCDGARDSNAGNPHDAALKLRCPTLNNNGFKNNTYDIFSGFESEGAILIDMMSGNLPVCLVVDSTKMRNIEF